MNLTVSDILEATGGHLVQGEAASPLAGVSTDSRTLRAGELFVALRGENFDGHDYVTAALKASAAAALVSGRPPDLGTDRPVVLVDDTVAAYGAVAAWWRARTSVRVVGVTGSNGKTTTKDMIAQLLEGIGPTLRTEENHNNHIGVPETLLRIRPHHRFAVVEMGTNHPGELGPLARLVRPHVAVITNVGPTHLEGFASPQGVAEEKGHLLDFLAPDGLAVLHADDPWSGGLSERYQGRRTTFGLSPDAQWRAESVRSDGERLEFELARHGQAFSIPVVGKYQVSNCLAAIAVAHELGLSVRDAARRFKTFVAPKWRMSVHQVGGMTLVLDCYNANPASMRAALEELASRAAAGRRVAVLGDMLELGRASEAAHRDLGRLVASAGLELLCAVGEHSMLLAHAALRRGMPARRVFWTSDKAVAAGWVCERLLPSDTVLFKASRGMRLEEVADVVEDWATAQAAREHGRPVARVSARD